MSMTEEFPLSRDAANVYYFSIEDCLLYTIEGMFIVKQQSSPSRFQQLSIRSTVTQG